MNLFVVLLIALPMCVAQFRIQGPSDGNRAAESLTVEEGGKVQYSGHSVPSSGGFSIQGASDGHSNVQGASDGHSNYQVQSASAEGANRYFQSAPAPPAYNIQRATDGHSQIQGSYVGSGDAKSLQYNDPSGLRVSWRSYDRQPRPGLQPEQQYAYSEVTPSAPRAAPQRQRSRARPQQQQQPQPQPQRQAQSHEPILPPVQPFESASPEIKQLLQFQKQLPYLNIIPEPFRYENIIGAQGNLPQPQQQQYEDQQQQYVPEPRRPPSRGKARIPSRQRRQAPQHQPAEQQRHYSTNLPPDIIQILKFQQQTPYINGIPEQFRFNTDAAVREQLDAVRAHYQKLATSPESQAPRPRHRRQAQHPQQQYQPQQPPPEPRLQYSTNVPGYIQDLLKYQSQLPYTILPNLIGTQRPEKPYVPQPVQAPAPAPQTQYQVQPNAYQQPANAYQQQGNAYQQQANAYQQEANAQQQQANAYQPQANAYQQQANAYQPQGKSYQGQTEAYQDQERYNQVYQSEIRYPQTQGLPGYQQSRNGIRPVTENQY